VHVFDNFRLKTTLPLERSVASQMPPLTDLSEIIGFFSYSREDDEGSDGSLSALRIAIQRELRAQLGRSRATFRLWQDQEAIAPGELWESKIKEAVEQAVFFIPIVTPTAVNSHYCKFEFEAFLAREHALGRSDLVFPLLYIRVPELDSEAQWRPDPLLSIIGVRQWVNWQQLRHRDVRTTEVREEVARFCEKIVEALRKPWLSPEERRKLHEIEAQRRAEEARQAADEKRRAEEEKRRAEEAQQAADEKRRAEAARQAKEKTRRASAARKADADRRDLAVFRDAPLAPELVMIPAGQFWMGSAGGEEGRFDNEGRHRVAIGQNFAIGRYPVTFDEYDRFCEAERSRKPKDEGWGRGRRPVINVSWRDARAYVAWLSQETRLAYRLPSEAEWEYACRAGTMTRYSFGDLITPLKANYADSGLSRTSEVGAYLANAWGLHDMHGNVWEWVEDEWHDDNYRGAPTDGWAWRESKTGWDFGVCVFRGGSWKNVSRRCRSACRSRDRFTVRNYIIGFRVARTLS
jgi:formylglycine-generating enzyme required for sulfatase activity